MQYLRLLLNYTFEIPVLGFVSLRGEPGLSDEPQHELMGTITEELLDVMKIKNEILSNDLATAKIQLERANDIIECGQSFSLWCVTTRSTKKL